MKSKTTKILALTAAIFGLQLSAANPVAVWDGDFTTTTKGGWTLSSTGSTITDAKITIGSTPITMTPSTTQNCGWYTIVYKVKGLKNTSQTPLATWGRPEVAGYNNPDLVGAFLDTDYPWGVWDGAERTKYSLQKKINLSSAGAEEHRVVVRFHSGVNYGVWAYVDGTKVFTADKDLKSSIDINRMTILGFQYNSGNVLTGAEVTSLAIFCDASDAGDAAFTSYKFPSDPQAISVNFNASTSARTVTGDPGAVYSDSNWHNLTGKSGTDVVIDNVKISYSASGVYNNDDMDKSYNKGYLDDNNSTHTTVTVSNLKNGYYNLVIYCSSDNATRFSYKTVNGKDYTYDSTTGAAKEGTASWGSNATSSAEPGNHALLIRNLKVDNGTIAIDSLRRDEGETRVRGSISAIQIAEVPYEATVTGDTNWANLNWTPTTPTSGANVKLIRSGDATDAKVTIDEDVTLGKLTVTSASGKALTLKVDNTLAAATYDFSGANGTVKIGGAGRVEYTTSGTNPAYPTWVWIAEGDDAWTGTYALSGFNGAANKDTCGSTGWNPTSYYNGTKSKFEFNGTVSSGYFWLPNAKDNLFGALVLKGSITFDNGYTHPTGSESTSITHYCFTKLSGSGSFTMNTSSSASPVVKFADVSDYTGTISVASSNVDNHGYCVTLGDGYLDTPAEAAIHLTGNVALDTLTLSAKNGVKIADDASLVFDDKDSKLTVSSSVAVNSGKTIPVKITDATGLKAGTELIAWTTQPSGDFSLVASGVEAGEKGFKATKGSKALTVAEDTATTYYEVASGETVTFDNQWLTDAGVTGSKTEEVQEKLDTPNANGIKMSDVYLMGYEAAEAQNAAVILKPDQAQSNGETISLSVAGVPNETRNGAVVTYKALASANRDWTNPTVEAEMDTLSVDMALPTLGVLYYRVQATVALP